MYNNMYINNQYVTHQSIERRATSRYDIHLMIFDFIDDRVKRRYDEIIHDVLCICVCVRVRVMHFARGLKQQAENTYVFYVII